jgi:hypothetical protein
MQLRATPIGRRIQIETLVVLFDADLSRIASRRKRLVTATSLLGSDSLPHGLRWDVNPPLKGKNSANDPFTVTGLNHTATMTFGTPPYETSFGNVAPS